MHEKGFAIEASAKQGSTNVLGVVAKWLNDQR